MAGVTGLLPLPAVDHSRADGLSITVSFTTVDDVTARAPAAKALAPHWVGALPAAAGLAAPSARGLWLPNGLYARELLCSPVVPRGATAISLVVAVADGAAGAADPAITLLRGLRLVPPPTVVCATSRLYDGAPFVSLQRALRGVVAVQSP